MVRVVWREEAMKKSGYAKWAHENKTRFVDVMCALAILCYVGQLMIAKLSVYAMSDDHSLEAAGQASEKSQRREIKWQGGKEE